MNDSMPQQNNTSDQDAIMEHYTHLWANFTAISAFLINRLPHKAPHSDTPFYRMLGKEITIRFYTSLALVPYFTSKGTPQNGRVV